MSDEIYLHITQCEADHCLGVFQRPQADELASGLLSFPRERLVQILGSALCEDINDLSSFTLRMDSGKIVGASRLQYLV